MKSGCRCRGSVEKMESACIRETAPEGEQGGGAPRSPVSMSGSKGSQALNRPTPRAQRIQSSALACERPASGPHLPSCGGKSNAETEPG